MATSSKRGAEAEAHPTCVTERASKNARLSSSSYTPRHVPKIAGLDDDLPKPVPRTRLDLDNRFFPNGLHPGTILEIKGPGQSGKSFLLTFLIARLVTQYPDKKAVLIDTRRKFNVRNYLSIICHSKPELAGVKEHINQPVPELLAQFPQLSSYLNRISVIRCYSAEELFLTLGYGGESVLQKLLLHDSQTGLVAVDCIDNFSYAESLEGIDKWNCPNVMELLKESVSQTKCQVICTSLVAARKYEYRQRRFPTQPTPSATPNVLHPVLPGPSVTPSQAQPQSSKNEQSEAGGGIKSNVLIEYYTFTNMLELVPAPVAEREKLKHPHCDKINHLVIAYLWSRQRANTAASGANHRVRFSIFSDMLWVADELGDTTTRS